eukprot:TRINITY_DN16495_c0_g1_i1.p1 TRINITY_DN16495_c0_g1~~TRINITY_DN16495_c0_g1_i1.p1  ORF type:complete len:343 (+),score=49.69 TRINITY_DN16495_c0_g1_i1:112-1029(+)
MQSSVTTAKRSAFAAVRWASGHPSRAESRDRQVRWEGFMQSEQAVRVAIEHTQARAALEETVADLKKLEASCRAWTLSAEFPTLDEADVLQSQVLDCIKRRHKLEATIARTQLEKECLLLRPFRQGRLLAQAEAIDTPFRVASFKGLRKEKPPSQTHASESRGKRGQGKKKVPNERRMVEEDGASLLLPAETHPDVAKAAFYHLKQTRARSASQVDDQQSIPAAVKEEVPQTEPSDVLGGWTAAVSEAEAQGTEPMDPQAFMRDILEPQARAELRQRFPELDDSLLRKEARRIAARGLAERTASD